MKLVGNLKKQVEQSENREETRNLIVNAGMELTDDELNLVTGGLTQYDYIVESNFCTCAEPDIDRDYFCLKCQKLIRGHMFFF